MEKVKANLASYEDLYNQSLSLERELEAATKEIESLQSQLQSVEAERDHMGEQVQCLKSLIEDNVARQAVINTEREQSQQQIQILNQHIQALEAENETLRAASSQTASKGQDPEESEGPELTSTETQTEGGPEAQVVEWVEAMQKRLETPGAQLAECVTTAKAKCLEQHQELEVVKRSLREVGTQLTTMRLGVRKPLEQIKFPGDQGQEDPEEETELGQSERSNPEKGLVGVKPMALQEEVLPALVECWNRRWDQWVKLHAREMSHLRHQLGELCKPRAKGGMTAPRQRQLVEGDTIAAGTAERSA
ncbi:hypothetical protein Y1Q_0024504 [Alligator mississippiensis]|uniref:Uncharacterized protein n=1 Tax=Alligator mississippiensis TaxID=8496 RepID=A0A151NAL7_ALLMI|nr:hypothetical protein Y1Q_0024504 [Alligator mississippiensis]